MIQNDIEVAETLQPKRKRKIEGERRWGGEEEEEEEEEEEKKKAERSIFRRFIVFFSFLDCDQCQ